MKSQEIWTEIIEVLKWEIKKLDLTDFTFIVNP